MSPKARWGDLMQKAASVLKSFSLSVDSTGTLTGGIDIDAAQGLADQQDLQADLTDLLVAVGEAAKDANRGLVLLFDEVQFFSTTQLEALISALHKTVQRGLPVTMVGAGPPQIVELAGDAKSYSERLFKFPRIGNLNEVDARAALAHPAQDEGADYTGGPSTWRSKSPAVTRTSSRNSATPYGGRGWTDNHPRGRRPGRAHLPSKAR